MKTVKIEGKVYVNSRASAAEPPQSITASIFNVVDEEVMITEIGIEGLGSHRRRRDSPNSDKLMIVVGLSLLFSRTLCSSSLGNSLWRTRKVDTRDLLDTIGSVRVVKDESNFIHGQSGKLVSTFN